MIHFTKNEYVYTKQCCTVLSHSVASDSCNPMDCSLLRSSVHRNSPGKILEWVAMPSSKGPSQPRDRIQVSCIAGRFFTFWATREARTKHCVIVFESCHFVLVAVLILSFSQNITYMWLCVSDFTEASVSCWEFPELGLCWGQCCITLKFCILGASLTIP